MAGAGYDLGANIYNSEGRVFQIDYAAKAANAGQTLVGLVCNDGVALCTIKFIAHPLDLPTSNPLIHKVSTKNGLAFSGYTQDGKLLRPYLLRECQTYLDKFGEEIDAGTLSSRLGSYLHLYTLHGGYRPVGVHAVIAGFDERENCPRLELVQNSGINLRFNGLAIGKGRQTAVTELERVDRLNTSIEDAMAILAEICMLVKEDGDTRPYVLEGAYVRNSTQEFEVCTPEEMRVAKERGQKRLEERNTVMEQE
eukprot:augustus_masked-scaffold_1-processed-gene-7.49-mRNA-1 protein AED:0.33 eAED:1.00 QI:0/-1/0/1/-1/1/1/0/252